MGVNPQPLAVIGRHFLRAAMPGAPRRAARPAGKRWSKVVTVQPRVPLSGVLPCPLRERSALHARHQRHDPLGDGRQVVEKKMVELEARGIITFEDDPGDTRKKLISRAHVNAVIAALTR